MSLFEELKRRNVVRVAALYVVSGWLVLQVAELLFETFGLPDWSMKLLVTLLLLGFPLVLVFSWVFEVTPDGIVRDKGPGSDELARHSRDRRTNVAIIVLLVIAIVGVAADRLLPDATESVPQAADVPAAVVTQASIAVLPFENLSDDAENEYFSDGLAEQLLNLLAKVPELKVTARTSSFSFKDTGADVPTIAAKLGVATVLEGSVQKVDDRVRIVAQLINAEDGYHLWSESYDRTFDDIFALQDEIAASVVEALRVELLGEPPRATETEPEAFALFLQALHFYRQRTPQGYDNAIDYLHEALALDDRHAPSWNLLSATYSNLAGIGLRPREETFQLAYEANAKALSIDPEYALANSARAWIAMFRERDYETAATYFRRARQLAPNSAVVMTNQSTLATQLGLLDEAIDLLERSARLDPVSAVVFNNLSDAYFRAGRLEDSETAALMAIELAPGMDSPKVNLAITRLFQERPESAAAAAQEFAREAFRLAILAMSYHDLGMDDASDTALATLTADHADTWSFLIAYVHAHRGNIDAGFEWLDRAIDGDQRASGLRSDPVFAPLMRDPRWQDTLEKVGLSDAQVARIEF